MSCNFENFIACRGCRQLPQVGRRPRSNIGMLFNLDAGATRKVALAANLLNNCALLDKNSSFPVTIGRLTFRNHYL